MDKEGSITKKQESATSKNVPKTGIVEKKWKKKRSQAQMIKKFARQKNITGELDTELFQYMIRIIEVLRTDFASFSDKTSFANNVYDEMINHEVDCARNQIVSRIIDSLLQYTSLEIIQRLVKALEPSLRQLSSDRCASHVLQRIIVVCADRGNREIAVKESKVKEEEESKSPNNDDDDTVIEIKPDEVEIYNNIVLKLSKYFLNNVEEFVFDTYANHVLRTVIQCLAGFIDTSTGDTGKKFGPFPTKRRSVIQEYKDLLIQGCQQIYEWPQFREFGLKNITSGFAQCILFSLKDIDKHLMKKIIKRILLESDNNEIQSTLFNTESSVRLMEACLMMSGPKTYCILYRTFFADNLEHLCQNQNTNFSVQRLIDSCINKVIFEEIFDNTVEHFDKILKRGFTGILASIGNACLRLHTKQGPFINAIMKILDCTDQTFVWSTATMKTQSQLEAIPNDIDFNLHGSLILQAMLKFNKPIKIVNSLLNMSTAELLQLFNDPKGSRILDAFLDSEYIGEKSREKLYKKLKGIWADLAKNTHGSRCVDKVWEKTVSNKQKIIIMEELAAAGESLGSTKSGQLMYRKLDLLLFMRNKNNWLASQSKQKTTKKLFADIINKK
ncbi:hypothetical protein HN011_012308 [Eciton burchellii]|nr:hypothetical protein HN011_012308 [Eciton burchellii]